MNDREMDAGASSEAAPDTLPASDTTPAVPPPSPDELVARQYRGAKESLRPLYDALVHIARRIDAKVRIEPTPTFVRFARRQPFAVVKAVGRDRVELGLALPGVASVPGLKPCRGMAGEPYVTHKLELVHLSQISAPLVIWVKRAYELTGIRAPPKVAPPDADAAKGGASRAMAMKRPGRKQPEPLDDDAPEEPRVPNPPPTRTPLKRSPSAPKTSRGR